MPLRPASSTAVSSHDEGRRRELHRCCSAPPSTAAATVPDPVASAEHLRAQLIISKRASSPVGEVWIRRAGYHPTYRWLSFSPTWPLQTLRFAFERAIRLLTRDHRWTVLHRVSGNGGDPDVEMPEMTVASFDAAVELGMKILLSEPDSDAET